MTGDWISEIAAGISIDSLPEEYQVVAEIIGKEAALRLMQGMGGMRIYVPKADKFLQERRDAMIRAEFNGFNHRALARKYKLSETWVREIVQRKPAFEQPELWAAEGGK